MSIVTENNIYDHLYMLSQYNKLLLNSDSKILRTYLIFTYTYSHTIFFTNEVKRIKKVIPSDTSFAAPGCFISIRLI